MVIITTVLYSKWLYEASYKIHNPQRTSRTAIAWRSLFKNDDPTHLSVHKGYIESLLRSQNGVLQNWGQQELLWGKRPACSPLHLRVENSVVALAASDLTSNSIPRTLRSMGKGRALEASNQHLCTWRKGKKKEQALWAGTPVRSTPHSLHNLAECAFFNVLQSATISFSPLCLFLITYSQDVWEKIIWGLHFLTTAERSIKYLQMSLFF